MCLLGLIVMQLSYRLFHNTDKKEQIFRQAEKGVCAVLVTYHPDPNVLADVIAALDSQTDGIIVIDNTEESHNGMVKSLSHVSIISFGENRGVAAAQNAGIRWARERGFQYVLLMDQDSVPAHDMVFQLIRGKQMLEEEGKPVAAVGPRCYNSGNNTHEPFVVRRNHWFKRVLCETTSDYFAVEYLISSGCLIALKTLNIVGEMDEALFIDHIDVEWGFRAKSKGLKCFVVCTATLKHHLGDVIKKKILSLNRKIIRHSPERYYYQYRNAILVFKRPYVSLSWVIYHTFRQLFPRFLIQILLISPRRANFMMMVTGLYHGFGHISGPLLDKN